MKLQVMNLNQRNEYAQSSLSGLRKKMYNMNQGWNTFPLSYPFFQVTERLLGSARYFPRLVQEETNYMSLVSL